MAINTIIINNKCYKFHTPTSYDEMKLLKKQIKQIKEKIKATETGCYKDKLTKNKKHFYYEDYPSLLEHLEKLIN